MTAHAQKTLDSIRQERATRLARLKERGIRDEISVMAWPSGMHEIAGIVKRGRFGCPHSHPSLEAWAKAAYGPGGKLRKIATGSVEGRPTVTYEVL